MLTLAKRHLLNLALLLGALGLGLIAWLEPGHTPPPQPENLTTVSASQVQKIRIERREGRTVVLERVAGHWRMREPVDAPASEFRIESLLRITEHKSLGRNPVAGLDLARYGLDKPAVRLFLDDAELEFGDSTPLDSRRYLRLGDSVHLIKDVAYYHLIGPWTGFLSLRLLPEEAQLTRLELPGLDLALQDGQWQVTPMPESYSADSGARLIDAWRTLQAIEVRPYAAEEPEGVNIEQVRLHLAGSDEPLVFQLTARTPDLVLARPDLGVAYHLPASRAADLLDLPQPPATD